MYVSESLVDDIIYVPVYKYMYMNDIIFTHTGLAQIYITYMYISLVPRLSLDVRTHVQH